MTVKKTYQLAHEPDVAWIIALWKAIHGGDPAPDAVADESSALMAAALASHLEEIEGASTKTSFERVQKGLATLGIGATREPAERTEREAELVEPTRPRDIRYCFKFEGQTICVTLPRIVHQVE